MKPYASLWWFLALLGSSFACSGGSKQKAEEPSDSSTDGSVTVPAGNESEDSDDESSGGGGGGNGSTSSGKITKQKPKIARLQNQTLSSNSSLSNLSVRLDGAKKGESCTDYLQAGSSNQVLVPESGLVFTGSVPDCKLNVSPASGQSGSSTITITYESGSQSDVQTFVVTISGSGGGGSSSGSAPQAAAIQPSAFLQGATSTITLSYSDADSDKATSCTLSNLTQVTISSACSCNGVGVCSVGVQGANGYTGAAGFKFSVSANGTASNLAQATLSILPDLFDNDFGSLGFGPATLMSSEWNSDAMRLDAFASASDRELVVADAHFDTTDLAAYWKFNGSGTISGGATVADASGNNLQSNLLNPNNLGVDYQSGKLNQSIRFTGVEGDQLIITDPVNASLDFGTADFSIALWMKYQLTNDSQYILDKFYNITPGRAGYYFRVLFDGTLHFFEENDLAGQSKEVFGQTILASDTWYFVVIRRSGNQTAIYLNGLVDGSNSSGSAIDTSSTVDLYIGDSNNGGPLTGNLDELSIWNRALSEDEIFALYHRIDDIYKGGNGSVTSRVMDSGANTAAWDEISWIPKGPYGKELPNLTATESAYTEGNANAALKTGLVGLWHLNGTEGANLSDNDAVADGSSSLNPGTAQNGADTNVQMSYEEGRFKQGIRFDGIDDKVSINSSASLDLSGNFSIQAWVQHSELGREQVVFSKLEPNDPSGFGLTFTGNDKLILFFANGSNYFNTRTTNRLADTNHIYHIVATHTAGTQKIYVDGVEQSLDQGGSHNANPASNAIEASIGHQSSISGAYGLAGTIDEVGLWNRVLTQAEVTSLFHRGALRLKLQVKSCAQADCSDAAFKGPDGSASTYYEDLEFTTDSTPTRTLTNAGTGRYFQYKAFLESDAPRTKSPELKSVEVAQP